MKNIEKRVYLIHEMDLPYGKTFNELTDDEVIGIAETSGLVWSSFESFVKSYNNDVTLFISNDNTYIRIVDVKPIIDIC